MKNIEMFCKNYVFYAIQTRFQQAITRKEPTQITATK